MAFGASPSVTPAIITASASVLAAAIVFIANMVVQAKNDRRKVQLARVDAQLRDLYGPLQALVSVNENLWVALRAARLPNREARRSGAFSEPRDQDWNRWLRSALIPLNTQMRDIIISHADLIVGDGIPFVLKDFCTHVASYEFLLSRNAPDEDFLGQALVPHPGAPFVTYVLSTFSALKREQFRLVNGRETGLNAGSRTGRSNESAIKNSG